MNLIEQFLASQCTVCAGATTPVKAFVRAFRREYPTSLRRWPRARIIMELSRLGYDCAWSAGVCTVVGLCLADVPRRVIDGQLV